MRRQFSRPQGRAHTLQIFEDKQLLEISHVMMSFFFVPSSSVPHVSF